MGNAVYLRWTYYQLLLFSDLLCSIMLESYSFLLCCWLMFLIGPVQIHAGHISNLFRGKILFTFVLSVLENFWIAATDGIPCMPEFTAHKTATRCMQDFTVLWGLACPLCQTNHCTVHVRCFLYLGFFLMLLRKHYLPACPMVCPGHLN